MKPGRDKSISRSPKNSMPSLGRVTALSSPHFFWLLAAVRLAIHATLAVTALGRKSLTIDEFAHLPAGVSYWETGHFANYRHNPPLVKLLAALPVIASGAATTYDQHWHDAQVGGYSPSHFNFGLHFMRSNAERYMQLCN